MDNISINEVLKNIEKFKKEKDNSKAIKYFSKNIYVRKYIPISEKSDIIKIVGTLSYAIDLGDNKIIDFVKNLEIIKIFYIFLKYTNIDIKNMEYNDCVAYDMIMQSGLYEYIVEICGKDYSMLLDMFKINRDYQETINAKSFLAKLNKDDFAKDIKEITDIIDGIKINPALSNILSVGP